MGLSPLALAVNRTWVRAILFGAGVILIALGEYRTVFGDEVAARIDVILGSVGQNVAALLPKLYPTGVATGIVLFAAGSVLLALGVGRLPAIPRPEINVPVERTSSRRWWISMTCLLGALGLLAALTASLLQQPHPHASAVVAWVAALAVGFVVMIAQDRARATRLGNPFSHRWEALSLAAIVALDLVLIGHDLADWRWAGTPDESYFFMTAKALAEGTRRFPLSEDGVFGYHPILSSYYQAAFMKLFGIDAFGWRLSSAAALAGSLPGLYLLARELWSRRVAYLAVLLFAPAQLAVGFAHHGYNNVQVYLVVLLSLGILAWAIRRASLVGYYLAGCVAALGFFTFHPARFAAILLLLLGWSMGGLSFRRGRRATTMALFAGLFLTALPVLANPVQSLDRMLAQTALAGGAAHGSRVAQLAAGVMSGEWVGRLWEHWFVALFYAAWSKTDHFVSNPIADPLSAGFASAGWWLSVASLRRQMGSRFLLPAYLLSVLAIGATSPYPHPPLTRLLFLSPFTALFAALAVDQLARWIGSGADRGRAPVAVAAVVVVCAIVWNVAATTYNVRIINHGYGDGTTSELIRIVQGFPTSCRIIYVQRRETFMDSVDFVLASYGMGDRLSYLRPFDQRAIDALEHVTAPAIVVYDVREDDKRARLEGILTARFPALVWRDSDPGQPWNLRYLYVPDA